MDGKTVFITGAAQGIGLSLAQAFAEQGANVVISDMNEQRLADAIAQHPQLTAYTCDVTKEQAIREAIAFTIEKFNTIDILINNAGFQYVSYIEDFPTEVFEQMQKVMLVAPFITLKYALPHMKKNNYGRILNMASINGVIGFAGKAGYNAAKHGLIGLTKVAALEVANEGITVNAICPGYVDTELVRNQFADLAKSRGIKVEEVLEQVLYPLVPQKRLLDVSEITGLALYLASDAAKGLTGQAIVLDGGYTAQ
ncbi:3-hydroxybutyrate dehydrogenase [Lysinibacillus sp. NPDC097195]|uniref:3-hydroxybutyrate dehydrogenase n=1 Tax=Lysinibacillus sp. NPDC097195 TaxID=3364141 RepID=UPI00380958B8